VLVRRESEGAWFSFWRVRRGWRNSRGQFYILLLVKIRKNVMDGVTYRSAKSGLASPIRSFAPFHVEPLRRFRPNSTTNTD
jgi:hypothetical protein